MILLKNKNSKPSKIKGNYINIKDGYKTQLQKLVLDGRSTQKTRSGKNLFRGLTLSMTNNDLTSTYNDINSNEVTINGTSTVNWANISNTNSNILLAGTYTLSINKLQSFNVNIKGEYEDNTTFQSNISKGSTTKTFTTTKNIKAFYIFISDSVNLTVNTTFKIELNKGSTASNEFEQYGASPSPEFPSEIESIEGIVQYKQIGDNIFNKNNVSFTLNAKKDVLDTGVRATVSVAGNYRYVAIKLGGSELLGKKITIQTKITPSANNKGQLSLFYGTSTTLNSQYHIVDVNTNSPTTASILDAFPNNFDTVWCCFYGNLTGTGNVGDYVDYTDVMFVIGDSIDNYKPYQETILNINLQGNKLCSLSNGVKDELIVENGRAKIIKNVQEDLLDGVNKKFTHIDMKETKTFLICNYSNPNIKKTTSENEVIPLSNKFRPTSIYNTWNGVVIYGISQAYNGTYLQFSFPKTIVSDLTLAGLNTWLASNNTKVQYQLKTPIEIDLGEVTQPKTFDGVNNISNSEDTNMLINYYNAFEFDKILRSGYEIDEQENEIFKKKMANGHRKKIVSSYIDCIIKINLGLLDNKTYQKYKDQLDDGEFQYWSYKYNQYKKANFILTKPSITTEYAYDDDIGIDDLTITLEKSSDVL